MRNTVFFVFIAAVSTAFAQYSDIDSEDIIVLSPFEVTSSNGYGPEWFGGSKVSTPLIDPMSAQHAPPVPVSIFRPADAVAVQFVLSHMGSKQADRNKELYESVEALKAAIESEPGLTMEQREVRFASGNKKLFSLSRGDSPVSFASVIIFGELSGESRLVDRVKQIRDLLGRVEWAGQTKAFDGSVGAYIKNPEQYRQEILRQVFVDLDTVKQGIGNEFEVRPSGLNQRVKTRVSSEKEIELWIDYTFSIHSIREMEIEARRSERR